jgi:hypothetical protein
MQRVVVADEAVRSLAMGKRAEFRTARSRVIEIARPAAPGLRAREGCRSQRRRHSFGHELLMDLRPAFQVVNRSLTASAARPVGRFEVPADGPDGDGVGHARRPSPRCSRASVKNSEPVWRR